MNKILEWESTASPRLLWFLHIRESKSDMVTGLETDPVNNVIFLFYPCFFPNLTPSSLPLFACLSLLFPCPDSELRPRHISSIVIFHQQIKEYN